MVVKVMEAYKEKRKQRKKWLKSKLSDTTASKEGISKGDKVEALCEIGEKLGVLCHGSL